MPEDSEGPASPAARAGRGGRPAGEAGPLRARLKETTERLERLRAERDEYHHRATRLQNELQVVRAAHLSATPPGKVLVDQETLDELRRAKRDLVRLLRRLGRPPLGWVFRRQKGYRRLRERWLREG